MWLSALRWLPFFQAAGAAEGTREEPGIAVVVVTGLALVFGILVLLTIILVIEGKIFAAIDRRKTAKMAAKAQAEAPPVAAAAAPPQVEPGIPPEVVAAIAAAVTAASDGAYTLKAVSAAKKGRGPWGLAGVVSSTEPF